MEGIRVRPALAGDAEAIVSVINQAFLVERFFIDGDRIQLPEVVEHLQRGVFLVAEDERGMAGCVYVEPRGERAYLGLLSVDPGRQRSGLGRRLVVAAEEHCRALGCRFMDLNIVNLREELPPFYRRLGYQDAGTAAFHSDPPARLPCHFLKMSKTL